jgi:hypothetical protein
MWYVLQLRLEFFDEITPILQELNVSFLIAIESFE